MSLLSVSNNWASVFLQTPIARDLFTWKPDCLSVNHWWRSSASFTSPTTCWSASPIARYGSRITYAYRVRRVYVFHDPAIQACVGVGWTLRSFKSAARKNRIIGKCFFLVRQSLVYIMGIQRCAKTKLSPNVHWFHYKTFEVLSCRGTANLPALIGIPVSDAAAGRVWRLRKTLNCAIWCLVLQNKTGTASINSPERQTVLHTPNGCFKIWNRLAWWCVLFKLKIFRMAPEFRPLSSFCRSSTLLPTAIYRDRHLPGQDKRVQALLTCYMSSIISFVPIAWARVGLFRDGSCETIPPCFDHTCAIKRLCFFVTTIDCTRVTYCTSGTWS